MVMCHPDTRHGSFPIGPFPDMAMIIIGLVFVALRATSCIILDLVAPLTLLIGCTNILGGS